VTLCHEQSGCPRYIRKFPVTLLQSLHWFMCGIYAKYNSYWKCRRKLRRKFRQYQIQAGKQFKITYKLHTTSSSIYRKRPYRRHVLHEAKLDEICDRLGITPRTFPYTPEEKIGRSPSLPRNARKLPLLRHFKSTVVHQPYDARCETKLNSTHW